MNVEEVFSEFDKLKVLIIGDVMLDSYLWGKVERISPEAPVPIVNVQKREVRLGGAGNVALNILSLGAKPVLCSVIGQDLDGDTFLNLLDKHGMEKSGIIQTQDRPTTIKHRIIAGSQQMLRVDSETDKEIKEVVTNKLLEKITLLLEDCQVVIFEDYDKGVITPGLIKHVVKMTSEKGIPTVVDPKKRNFLAYEGVTLFKPNLKELKEGLKIDFDKADKNEVQHASSLLREKLNIKSTLITLSEHGIFVSDGENNHFIPAHLRSISDVSGAGDTVVSVAALALALKLPLKQVAELSNLAGGIVCEYIGVVPIHKARLKEEAKEIFN
ncbi:MAG: D-glycero-beta-D-manno-heptose-7-phosphate kinase [Opitutaceae bacterium]|nr:D-glycero-beta-D-manno-heptose-7-phosphate kinase [Cytophagales bacterium]